MVLSVKDWLFDVNIEATSAYSDKVVKEHCQCGYCRNFYGAVDAAYPQLRAFLAQFGIHVDAPEELMPFEPTIYSASYCICGRIIHFGKFDIDLNGISLHVLTDKDVDYDTECPLPYFVLRTSYLECPWILDEDMDEVISPANEPEYLQRMWNRLLTDAELPLMDS